MDKTLTLLEETQTLKKMAQIFNDNRQYDKIKI